MSEYRNCILAPNGGECVELFDKCMKGDDSCIAQFIKLKDDYKKGVTRPSNAEIEVIRNYLSKPGGLGPFLSSGKPSDEIVATWLASLGNTPEEIAIKNSETLRKIVTLQVEFVNNPDFSGDPTTMKTSKAFISPRPCSDKRAFGLEGVIGKRPIPKKVVIGADGVGRMVGGGSRTQAKNLSYVNKIRYLDSLNTYYNMVGGDVQPTNCCNDLQKMYAKITNDLQTHGKQVEASDNNIIETMLNKFAELETKVAQIQENISKLSSVSGTNVSGVLEAEKEKLKTESKYLSSQGKTITSVIRSLFESIDQVPVSYKTLTNARLQFPQHTINY